MSIEFIQVGPTIEDSPEIRGWLDLPNPERAIKSLRSTSTITTLLFKYGRIITADDEGVIQIFDHHGQQKFRFKGHTLGIWCLATTRTKLISGSDDKTIRVWNLLTGACTHVFRGHTDVVHCLQILRPQPPLSRDPDLPPDQALRSQPIRPLIVSGSRDGSVRVWMLPRPTEAEYGRQYKNEPEPDPDPQANPYFLYHLTGHEGAVRCVAADRKVVLSGGVDCTIRAHDIKANKLLGVLRGHTDKITSLIIDARLKMWYSASVDGTIRMWDSEDGSLHHVITEHKGPVTMMFKIVPRLCTASEDGLVKTWTSAFGEPHYSFNSSDGNYLDLTGDQYKVLTLTEASAKFFHMQRGGLVRTLYQCSPGEKLSHIAADRQQCALTYKDSRGHNRLMIIDFRGPGTYKRLNYPQMNAVDTDDLDFMAGTHER